jgi:hypothetical protein
MFRLAQLVAVAAATTTAADAAAAESKAKASLKKAQKNVTDTVLSSTKVAGLEIPQVDGKAATYADLAADDSNCVQCLLADGATWSAYVALVPEVKGVAKKGDVPAVLHVAEVPAVAAHCVTSTEKTTAIDKLTLKDKTLITLQADLTYEEFFAGLATCAATGVEVEADIKDSFTYVNGAALATAEGTVSACPVAYDAATFKTDKTSAVKFSWTAQDAATQGYWCYINTALPADGYSGGLLLTHMNDADTKVAIKIDSTIDRYFDNASMKSMGIGKTGKVPIYGGKSIQVYMAQNNKFVEATDKTADFDVTFTRMSYVDMGKLVAEHGGAIVWIIIAVVACLLCAVGIIVWKCFCSKKENEGENNFYYAEDCYSRV